MAISLYLPAYFSDSGPAPFFFGKSWNCLHSSSTFLMAFPLGSFVFDCSRSVLILFLFLVPGLIGWPFPILISCRAADLIKWSGRVELYPNLFVTGMMNDDIQSRLQQIYVTFMQYQKGIFHCHNGIMLKMICQWCFCMESSTIDEHEVCSLWSLFEYNSLVGTRMFCISTAAVIVWRKW